MQGYLWGRKVVGPLHTYSNFTVHLTEEVYLMPTSNDWS